MLLIFAALLACAVDQDRLGRPSEASAPALEAPPPAARGPEEEALYQVLFAGETGAEARALGDRARALAWFSTMELSPEQLEGLATLTTRLDERVRRITEAEEAMGARELETVGAVYRDLVPALVAPEPPTDEELAAFGTALSAAREQASPGTLYRVRHETLRAMLEDCRGWIATLDEGQQTALGTSRFLLRHRVGALVAPGDHAELLGTVWDGASFDTLVLGRLPVDEEPLDIGGLWASEDVRNTPDHQLGGVQKQVLVLLLTREEGLLATIEVALGRRDPVADLLPDAVSSAGEPGGEAVGGDAPGP